MLEIPLECPNWAPVPVLSHGGIKQDFWNKDVSWHESKSAVFRKKFQIRYQTHSIGIKVYMSSLYSESL